MLIPQVTDDSAYAATPSAEQGSPLSLLQFLVPVATGGLFATFCSATKGGAKKALAQAPQGAMPSRSHHACRVRPAEGAQRPNRVANARSATRFGLPRPRPLPSALTSVFGRLVGWDVSGGCRLVLVGFSVYLVWARFGLVGLLCILTPGKHAYALGRFIIFNERKVFRIIAEYICYYNLK